MIRGRNNFLIYPERQGRSPAWLMTEASRCWLHPHPAKLRGMSLRRYAVLFEAACVFFGIAASLTAQQAPASDPVLLLRADAQQRTDWATECLRSEDPLRVAWGAW